MQSSIVIIQQLLVLIGSPYSVAILLPVNLEIMFYDGYHVAGMHIFWWFVWLMFLIWIFATPYSMMGYRMLRESSSEVLKRRLASGEITTAEYYEKKAILEAPLGK